MPEMLCTGAALTCTFGAAPSVFSALPLPAMPLQDGAMPVAAIDQIIPPIPRSSRRPQRRWAYSRRCPASRFR
jgi:hypothetical protein